MSYLYTNENTKRNQKMNNLLDLINPIVVWDDTLIYYPYIVKKEESMRIDLICFSIYNHFNYIDELLTINNILNPWSINEGQIIYYIEEDDMSAIKRTYGSLSNDDQIAESLVNPNKDTKKDPNRDAGTGLPASIKPAGIKDVSIDFNDKKIKIIDKFK